MSDSLESLIMQTPPTAARPLLGMTVLVIEDSRFACEALRLLCLRSGARIRRADRLESARRHLATYRPTVIIVDLGLPDGSGTDLIRELTEAPGPRSVVLGTSGDDTGRARALAAGADGFLAKPIENLALFQETVLATLPPDNRPKGPRVLPEEFIVPDKVAFCDDLAHVADVLTGDADAATVDYVAQFVSGVARSAHDQSLEDAARALGETATDGPALRDRLSALAELVHARLEDRRAV